MEILEALHVLKMHKKTSKAAAEYVGYTPEYFYLLTSAGEKMPKKAQINIIRAAEILITREAVAPMSAAM